MFHNAQVTPPGHHMHHYIVFIALPQILSAQIKIQSHELFDKYFVPFKEIEMEILIGLIVLVAVGYLLYVNNSKKPLDLNKDGKVDAQDALSVAPVLTQVATQVADVNKDGKVDSADAKAAVDKVVSAADLNQDGKVDVADAVEAVKKTKRKAKETAEKVKTAVKKTAKPKK